MTKPTLLRAIAGISAGVFFLFLLLAITIPENQQATTWLQVTLSITIITIVLLLMKKKRKQVQEGMDAINSLIPITAGGMLVLVGLLGVMAHFFNTDLGMGGFLTLVTGVLFMVLGGELIFITLMALRSGKQTTKLIISFFVAAIVDLIVASVLEVDFMSAMLFLLISKAVLVVLLVMLGLRLSVGKVDTVQKSFSQITNWFFMGIVFFVIIISILFPAYYLFLYSSGAEVSTVLNIQNPIMEEFIREAGLSTEASANFLLAMARALSPIDFQTLTINLDAVSILATTLWTGVLGLSLTGISGTEIPVAHILFAEMVMFIIFIFALRVTQEHNITFAELEKMKQTDWFNKAIKKIWERKTKKDLEGEK